MTVMLTLVLMVATTNGNEDKEIDANSKNSTLPAQDPIPLPGAFTLQKQDSSSHKTPSKDQEENVVTQETNSSSPNQFLPTEKQASSESSPTTLGNITTENANPIETRFNFGSNDFPNFPNNQHFPLEAQFPLEDEFFEEQFPVHEPIRLENQIVNEDHPHYFQEKTPPRKSYPYIHTQFPLKAKLPPPTQKPYHSKYQYYHFVEEDSSKKQSYTFVKEQMTYTTQESLLPEKQKYFENPPYYQKPSSSQAGLHSQGPVPTPEPFIPQHHPPSHKPMLTDPWFPGSFSSQTQHFPASQGIPQKPPVAVQEPFPTPEPFVPHALPKHPQSEPWVGAKVPSYHHQWYPIMPNSSIPGSISSQTQRFPPSEGVYQKPTVSFPTPEPFVPQAVIQNQLHLVQSQGPSQKPPHVLPQDQSHLVHANQGVALKPLQEQVSTQEPFVTHVLPQNQSHLVLKNQGVAQQPLQEQISTQQPFVTHVFSQDPSHLVLVSQDVAQKPLQELVPTEAPPLPDEKNEVSSLIPSTTQSLTNAESDGKTQLPLPSDDQIGIKELASSQNISLLIGQESTDKAIQQQTLLPVEEQQSIPTPKPLNPDESLQEAVPQIETVTIQKPPDSQGDLQEPSTTLKPLFINNETTSQNSILNLQPGTNLDELTTEKFVPQREIIFVDV